MDIVMPVMNGIEALEIIVRHHPSVRVIMLTGSEEDKNLFQAIRSGAKGYILKNLTSDRLHEQLRDVVRGEVALSPSLAAKIWNEFSRLEDTNGRLTEEGYEQLTGREIQILELVADGFTNQGIAAKLNLSTNTVKKYIGVILGRNCN